MADNIEEYQAVVARVEKAIKVAEDEASTAAVAPRGCPVKMNSIADDALNLFTVKTDPIVQAMQVVIGRISTGLTSCLVDWRNFLDRK